MAEATGLRALIDEGTNDVITFTTTTIASEGGRYDISPWTIGTVELATGAMRSLTSTSDITHYAWSPDGTRLAYLFPPAPSQLERDLTLVILDMHGSTVRRFSGDPQLTDASLVWFPDCQRLLLAGERPGEKWAGTFYILDVATGVLDVYARLDAPAFEWSWSPDRKYAAFAVASEGSRGLFVHRVATGTTELLVTPADHPCVQSLEWSPDGAHIAFRADGDEADAEAGLYVMTWSGADIRRVADLAFGPGEHLFAWSPDGQRLAFISTILLDGAAPQWDNRLGVVEVAGEGPRWLATGLNAEGEEIVLDAPAWSPDGTRIVYSSYQDGGHNLYVVAADGSAAPRPITHDTSNHADTLKYSLAWRPVFS